MGGPTEDLRLRIHNTANAMIKAIKQRERELLKQIQLLDSLPAASTVLHTDPFLATVLPMWGRLETMGKAVSNPAGDSPKSAPAPCLRTTPLPPKRRGADREQGGARSPAATAPEEVVVNVGTSPSRAKHPRSPIPPRVWDTSPSATSTPGLTSSPLASPAPPTPSTASFATSSPSPVPPVTPPSLRCSAAGSDVSCAASRPSPVLSPTGDGADVHTVFADQGRLFCMEPRTGAWQDWGPTRFRVQRQLGHVQMVAYRLGAEGTEQVMANHVVPPTTQLRLIHHGLGIQAMAWSWTVEDDVARGEPVRRCFAMAFTRTRLANRFKQALLRSGSECEGG